MTQREGGREVGRGSGGGRERERLSVIFLAFGFFVHKRLNPISIVYVCVACSMIRG